MYSPQDLAALVAVADTGSVRAAASALGRTQPAMTQAIRRLEDSVGFSLLDRSFYRARLTERGELFVKRARVTVGQARSLRAFAVLLARGVEPRLKLAVHGAIPDRAWLDVVAEIPKRFPDSVIEVEAREGDAPLRRLLDGDAHLAIMLNAFPDRFGTSTESKTMGEVEFCNAVRADKIDQLQEGFALIPQILSADFDDPAASYGVVDGHRHWRVNDHRMKAAAIVAGMGWGSLPTELVEKELQNGTLQAVCYLGLKRRSRRAFSIYRKRNQPLGPIAAHIWEGCLPYTLDDKNSLSG